jgi:uncharacterized membrane protein
MGQELAGRLAARVVLIALFVLTVVYFDGWRGLLVLVALSAVAVFYVKYVRKQGSSQP